MTQKEYDTALNELIKSTLELTGSIMGADAKATELYNQLLIDRKPVELPKLKERDTTFDYKRSKPDIVEDKRDNAKENAETIKSTIGGRADELAKDIEAKKLSLEELQKKYETIAPEMVKALNDAMGNVTSLDEALKIATVKQDIEDLSKEIRKGVFSGVKDVASSADRMVSSFQNIRQVFSNVDSTGWEKIMAVWDALINTVDGFMSILDMIDNLIKLTERLTAAKQTESLIDKKTTNDKVANAAIGMTADISAAGVKATTASTEVAANTASGTTEVVKSAAKLPFPLNLLAMAGAAASAIAIFSSLPKFENGGIVGGISFTGDKILTRLNSGEMVLNKGQQNIVGAAISRNAGTNVTIGGQVRGADIYLALKNYQKQTGKKL